MTETTIEWTRGDDGSPGVTWNPVSGCSKVSQGCKHCYAERVFPRPYPGRAFTDVRTHPERLQQPLRWRRQRRVFVNSMSDLFHEDVPDEFIDQVWAVMAIADRHTFQILTKRPERMREYLGSDRRLQWASRGVHLWGGVDPDALSDSMQYGDAILPNVWLGVSVEDQETADERIPLLLQTPAAVRFISAEPLLGPIVLGANLRGYCPDYGYAFGTCSAYPHPSAPHRDWDRGAPVLDWVIVGGESGPHARECDIEWVRWLVKQCKSSGTPVFVKQLGARTTGWCFGNCDSDGVDCTRNAFEPDVCQSFEASEGPECPDGRCCMRRDRKGGDPTEWPADLRVREFP